MDVFHKLSLTIAGSNNHNLTMVCTTLPPQSVDLNTTDSNTTDSDYGYDTVYFNGDEEGAMVYIVVVVCIFAMAIILLIAAQMSYNPDDSQVNKYLKQRSLLKDLKLLEHMHRRRTLSKQISRIKVHEGVQFLIASASRDNQAVNMTVSDQEEANTSKHESQGEMGRYNEAQLMLGDCESLTSSDSSNDIDHSFYKIV